MRYTKYQYKKNNNKSKFITSLIMTLFAAGIVGLILFKIIITFIMPVGGGEFKENPAEDEIVNINEGNEEVNFQFIQCGYFGSEDNAKQALSKISSEYSSFIIKEDDKFRVSAGIFSNDEGDRISEELNAKGINNAKVKYTLNTKDVVEGQIAAITEGYLSIITALKKEDVKSVDTTDFKTWISKLSVVDSGNNFQLLEEYKRHIEQLEDEIKRENVSEEYQYIYKILENFKED